MILKKLTLSFSLLVAASIAPTAVYGAQPAWAYVGEFSSVSMSNESGDCDGYVLRLWKISSKPGPQMAGIFTHADGPCDKQGTPIYNVNYSTRKREIEFASPNESSAVMETRNFKGRIEAEQIAGVLTTTNHEHSTSIITPLVLKKVPPALTSQGKLLPH